jgi:uncharacterized protein YqhQ
MALGAYMAKKTVGGQAVLEGVLMRSGKKTAVAVRKKRGIKVKKDRVGSLADRYGFLKWPFFRGVINMFEMIVIGIKALEWSAQEAVGEEEQLGKGAVMATVAFALAFGIFLFVLVPYFFTYFVGLEEQSQPLVFNLIDGVFKLAILIAYIVAIGLLKDVRVLFQYHGAEHKAVACYEQGLELNARNCRQFSTAHARCGTSFLLLVILIGVVLLSFVPVIMFGVFPGLAELVAPARFGILFVARVLLLPVIAGLAYEFLKLSGKHSDKALMKPLIWPGMAVQKLTTRQPNDRQVEVAIAALKAVI